MELFFSKSLILCSAVMLCYESSIVHIYRLLCEAVMNFQTTQEEVSLIVDPLKTRLKNYVEDESGRTPNIDGEVV